MGNLTLKNSAEEKLLGLLIDSLDRVKSPWQKENYREGTCPKN